jgi:hypothetical protein
MKALLQLSFLAFYIASSYAITQERAALQVEGAEDRLSGQTGSFEQNCQDCHFAFPHFRQAKPKPTADVHFFRVELAQVLPVVSTRVFAAQTISFKSISTLENTHLRAPPIQL